MNLERLNLNQIEPKSAESKNQHNILKIYFVVWAIWSAAMFILYRLLGIDTIAMGLLLLYGMLHLNDQLLALYSFFNLIPFIGNVTYFLDYTFSLGKSSDSRTG